MPAVGRYLEQVEDRIASELQYVRAKWCCLGIYLQGWDSYCRFLSWSRPWLFRVVGQSTKARGPSSETKFHKVLKMLPRILENQCNSVIFSLHLVHHAVFSISPVCIHGSLVVTVFLGTTRRNLRVNQQKSFATHSTRWLPCTSVECAGKSINFGRKSMYVSQQITFRDR
jgi:hypothetical protein